MAFGQVLATDTGRPYKTMQKKLLVCKLVVMHYGTYFPMNAALTSDASRIRSGATRLSKVFDYEHSMCVGVQAQAGNPAAAVC